MGWCSKCTRLFCFVFDLEKIRNAFTHGLVCTRKPETWTWKNCTQPKLKNQYPSFVNPNWPNPTFCYLTTSSLLLLTTVLYLLWIQTIIIFISSLFFFLSALPPISNFKPNCPQEHTSGSFEICMHEGNFFVKWHLRKLPLSL